MSDEGRRSGPAWVLAGQLTAVVFEFGGSIVGAVVMGWLADRYFGTDPWLLIVSTLLGTGAGFYRMVLILRHFERRGES